jgi:aerobic-type carbon monoxide dehydrogenase small subunit (CoxS/CutS family)
MNTMRISLTINGASTGPHEIPVTLPMIDYLHEYCGLTGTKFGCGIGACRACVIIQDHDDGTSETRQYRPASLPRPISTAKRCARSRVTRWMAD